MKFYKLNFPKVLTVVCFFLLSSIAFSQTREEAVNILKEAFSTRFVKTEVVRVDESGGYTYDYEITGSYIVIRSKFTAGEDSDPRNHHWTYLPMENIGAAFSSNAEFPVFKKTTSLIFTSAGSSIFKTGNGKIHLKGEIYATQQQKIPFKLGKDDPIVDVIMNAIKIIAVESAKETKIAEEKLNAEKRKKDTDDLFTTDNRLKQIAYYKLPSYEVFTSDSVKVNLATYMEKNRTYMDKPTLLVTFSSIWCGPCLKIIDSLLTSEAALKYNIVLVNRDEENPKKVANYSPSFSDIRKKIAARTPNYNEKAILLFDRNNQFEDIDNNSAPFFIWFDKKLNIIGTYNDLRINTPNIISTLDAIDNDKSAFSFTRYYDFRGFPCKIDKAYKKVEMAKVAETSLYQVSVYDMNNKVPISRARYTKDEMGRFIRQKE